MAGCLEYDNVIAVCMKFWEFLPKKILASKEGLCSMVLDRQFIL